MPSPTEAPAGLPAGPSLPPPAHAAALPPGLATAAGVRVLPGVAYAALPGCRPLELDLYLPPEDRPPEAPGPVPVVVFLHGGGWRLGGRHSAGPAFAGASPSPFERVAAAGVAVASVDYRLSGEAIWPAQLHDAKAAVRWLRSRAGELGVDPDRIAAWGESAGGHLALLLGLTGPDHDGDLGIVGPSSAVSAVAAWYPPSDLPGLPGDLGADPADPGSREAQLLGGPLASRESLAREASPVSYVRHDAPPILLLHGRVDRLIPCVQTERLAERLSDLGAEFEVELLDGADHMWRGAPAAAEHALVRTIEFLHRANRVPG